MNTRTNFSRATKRNIENATGGICAFCMMLAIDGEGNACHIVDAANTVGMMMEAESAAMGLDIVGRSDQANGLWLCGSCHYRISYGQTVLCPPAQLIDTLTEALESNPAAHLLDILQRPKAMRWASYYLLIVPNIDLCTLGPFAVRKAKGFKFVENIGLVKRLKSNIAIIGEPYYIYDTQDGALDAKSGCDIIDLARDEKRSRRLWKIPHIDVLNSLFMSLWHLKMASTDTSSHHDVTLSLAKFSLLLWQRRLNSSTLAMGSSTDDEDTDGEDP
ncbi:hypothetical protein B0H16DRAFT_1733658 [Mycena metata]|uniref:Uncharacterized protein n=1 Tax=Mycena metata TaxID=1033252 RepID=A0AAD7MT28_9AGAR|nr:hypothetical protein B0H16DRAFT_1733658 [Mycena metata]